MYARSKRNIRPAAVFCDLENLFPARRLLHFAASRVKREANRIAEALPQYLNRLHVKQHESLRYMYAAQSLSNMLHNVEDAFTTRGFQMCWVSSGAENAAETQLATDVSRMLATRQPVPLPSLVILVSGDADLLPLVAELKSHGHQVWIVSRNAYVSQALRVAADRFIAVEWLLERRSSS